MTHGANPSEFQRYVDLVGGRKEAARRLGLSDAMVGHILSGIRGISVRVAQSIESDSGGRVSRSDLRPDIWPKAA
jgi:DNA-binding transcriptional regulator YdaS (Cro superfamily)